ncbi:MAG TPA: hypothetical protein ENN07_02090, partial [candidate division Zixibacteria bacterium]|nr:hypothetical protein [candidate division Zixibacteria bacterium]
MNAKIKIIGLAICTAALVFFSQGCDTYIVDRNPYYYDSGGGYSPVTPPRPTNVRSVTGDRRVYLYWTPVSFSGFDGYAVYRGASPTGYYDYIGSTYSASFTDVGLTNGITYYYAVAT